MVLLLLSACPRASGASEKPSTSLSGFGVWHHLTLLRQPLCCLHFCEASSWQRVGMRSHFNPHSPCCRGTSPCAPHGWLAAPHQWPAGGTGSGTAVVAAVPSICTSAALGTHMASQLLHGLKKKGWRGVSVGKNTPAVKAGYGCLVPCPSRGRRCFLPSFGDESPVTARPYGGFPLRTSCTKYRWYVHTHVHELISLPYTHVLNICRHLDSEWVSSARCPNFHLVQCPICTSR